MSEETIVYFGHDLEAMTKAVNYNNWIISEFDGKPGKNVVEIGAGCGNFTESLLNSGVERILACEPSENMFSLACKRFENDKRVSSVNSCLNAEILNDFSENFDSVAYVNVLEHIEDDEKELKTAYNLMNPGCRLLIFVPAMPVLMSLYDRSIGHFRRYGKQELKNKVSNAGFKILKCRYLDYLGFFAWYFSMKIMKCVLHKANVGIYDKFAVPIMRPIEKYIRMPFGKSLLLIAER